MSAYELHFAKGDPRRYPGILLAASVDPGAPGKILLLLRWPPR